SQPALENVAIESQPALENVAIGKTATQSSDWSASYPASNAVDGNTNTNWNSGSCTSTKDNQNAWWKVDLGGNYLVHEVIVTNRLDCCETRILNAEIRVGLSDDISQNSQCGEKITSSQTSQANIHIQCSSPIVGRYVSMHLVDRSDLLNFCEMQVMAEESQPALENVAIGKTATQSSDWSASYPATNAVDGNTKTNWNSGSCTSTKDNQNAWWKVDLGGNYLVHEVIVTNRLDCCETRILNAEIRVGLSDDISQNSQCGEKITSSQTSQANIHIQCSSPIVGRYVSMQLVDRSDLLNFCEMQVMAEESQPALENVAIGKTATQSSDWSASYPASNAVDGNTNTNWNSGSCTSTKDNQNAWWKVDLGGNYLVHEVIVTNRLDCCEIRILNAEIRVGLSDDISENSQCGEKITSSQTSQANIHIQCSSPIVGRYVSMQLVDRSDLLNFCEMQVMAEESQPALENVAIGKTATQSSDWSASYPASNAVDGNTNTNWNSGSCTSTKDNQNAWWKVDLGGNYLVHEVIVTNRLDCC
ncbi:uncharacterized protein LOC102801273, partial [Saccoglossus kowalevskii]|uniref:Uncharacterized protein LOC102801273 n=1 Tax=Saccoglossus kowalevskii TaxID=10224 RepID=A0ABM0MXI3_SACKO